MSHPPPAAKEHRWNWFLARAMPFTFSSLETLDWQFRAKYNLASYRQWLKCNKQVWPVTTSKKPDWLFSMSSRSRWGTTLNFNLFMSSCPVSCWHNWLEESRASPCSEIILGGSSCSRKMFPSAAGRALAVPVLQQISSAWAGYEAQTTNHNILLGSGEEWWVTGPGSFAAAGWAAKSARVNLEHVWLYQGGVMLLP